MIIKKTTRPTAPISLTPKLAIFPTLLTGVDVNKGRAEPIGLGKRLAGGGGKGEPVVVADRLGDEVGTRLATGEGVMKRFSLRGGT